MSLLEERVQYKPFKYPWAYDAWLQQQRLHWLPEEVPLADDVKDWHRTLTAGERNLLTHIFRFFTQSDVEVNNCYWHTWPPTAPTRCASRSRSTSFCRPTCTSATCIRSISRRGRRV